MRDYAKVGGRKGLPGYRTPSVFRYKSSLRDKVLKVVSKMPKGKTIRPDGKTGGYNRGTEKKKEMPQNESVV